MTERRKMMQHNKTGIQQIGEIKGTAQNIVSLAPSLTECLFFLGLDGKIVGVTEQCDHPVEARQKRALGTFSQPQAEQIQEAGADLVVGLSRFHGPFLGTLAAEKGIPSLGFNYTTVEEILASLERMARAAGEAEGGRQRVDLLRARLEKVKEQTSNTSSKPRVFRLMTEDPLVIPTVSCYQYDALLLAGAQPFAFEVEEPYSPVPLAEVQAFDPQIILSCGREKQETDRLRCKGCRALAPSCLRVVGELGKKEEWNQTSAARQECIHAVPCGYLCRPGPRIVEGIEQLAALFAQAS